jgi:4-hydroxybenzoyl-CoA reductase subunit alpha
VDGWEKVTGQAKFTADLQLPGMLVGKILRSPLPHARIMNIDTSKAKRIPGIVAVVTGEDTIKKKYGAFVRPDEYGLAVDKVRYVGDEVAAVASIDEDSASEALDEIKVEYQELPAVFDPVEAMREGAPIIHEEEPNNVSYFADFHWGNVDEGFKKCDYIREDTFSTQDQVHCSMEPHAAFASFVGCELTLYSTTQGPYYMRRDLSLTLGIPESRIRVIKPHVGGGFGGKREMLGSDFCAAILSIKTGRPVKIVYSRMEEFIATRQRHPMYITLKTGCLKDGTILAKECVNITDGGAYNSRGPVIVYCAGTALASLYRVPNVRYRGYHVYTNKPVGGAFRGFGYLQMRFADESQIDMIAEDLGIDSVDLRLKNAVRAGDVTANGFRIQSCGFTECITRVAETSRWWEKRIAKKKGWGIGIACNDYVSGAKQYYDHDSSTVLAKLNEDGDVDVLTGASDIGQGSDTTLAQIVAEELGVPVQAIHITSADTKITPVDLGTYASRVTLIAGNAAKRAAADLKIQLFRWLANHWGVAENEICIYGGQISCSSEPHLSISFAEAARLVSHTVGGSIIGRGYYNPSTERTNLETGVGNQSPAYSYGALTVEVEVDLDIGQVYVKRLVQASDCGYAINPQSIEGQAEGAGLCGIGMTLLEDRRIAEDGRTLNPNFVEYKIPTIFEIPEEIKVLLVESVDPEGPFGAKGVSEGFQVPVAPAIANAIYNAIGIRFKDLPITPEKILAALKARKE